MPKGYELIDEFYGNGKEDEEYDFIEYLKDIYDNVLYILGFYDLEYEDNLWNF